MQTKHSTVLITGGGSGIGFETAKLFSETGSHVIIVGRNEEKLQKTASQLTNVTAIRADLTNESEVDLLSARIVNEFPGLDILINNAGTAHAYDLSEGTGNHKKAEEEILTNYLATIRLTEKLLPVLKRRPNAAVVIITSIVSFAPSLLLPSYSASKAALHSYIQPLRHVLETTSNVKVFEVMPPLVDTGMTKELKGDKMAPETVAREILNALELDQFEVHIGATSVLYQAFRKDPSLAFKTLNRIQVI